MADTVPRGPFIILWSPCSSGSSDSGSCFPLLPIFVEEFNASPFWIGALFAGYGLSRMMFTPSIGSYSDRYGRKWFITAGLGLYTLISVWYIFAGSIMELFVIRFVHGIASALISSVSMSYVGDITPRGQKGSAHPGTVAQRPGSVAPRHRSTSGRCAWQALSSVSPGPGTTSPRTRRRSSRRNSI